MHATYFAKNYRGLRNSRLEPPSGLSALVGPNGAGKTTLLFLPEVLKLATAATGALGAAIEATGGVRALRHLGAAPGEPVEIGVEVGPARWTVEVTRNGGVSDTPGEHLTLDSRELFRRAAGSLTYSWQQGDERKEAHADSRLVLRRLADADLEGTFPGRVVLDALGQYAAHFDYDLPALRRGSDRTPARRLDTHGRNALAVLRNWRVWSKDYYRWEFVIDSLRECFGFVEDLDFQEGGNIVEGHVVLRGHGRQSVPAADAANGFLAALVHFTAVASADAGGVVAIDELENSLHPRAIHQALACIDDFASAKSLAVVVATQSPQVLDWFDARPAAVLVMQAGSDGGPVPLDRLRNPEWLSHFRLGQKFAEGDFGAEPADVRGRG